MKKAEVIQQYFNGSAIQMADALRTSKQCIYQMPDVLSSKQEDWFRGAMLRLGREREILPKHLN